MKINSLHMIDCWQSVFLRKSGRDIYEAGRSRLEGLGRDMGAQEDLIS